MNDTVTITTSPVSDLITVSVLTAGGGGASITNATVNAAIGEDPSATRTALELGTAALAATGDFDAAGAASAAQTAAADDATTKDAAVLKAAAKKAFLTTLIFS
jgi:hypothetical protein